MFHSSGYIVGRARFFAAVLIILGGTWMQARASGLRDGEQAGPSMSAKVLIGLPGIASNAGGDLSFSSTRLIFTAEHSSAEIARSNIVAVWSGDERVETGGTPAKVARVLIPYGGGLALGAVTHKKVGLLTVEYLDDAGEYHGAVLLLKTQDIASAVRQLDFHAAATSSKVSPVALACPVWKIEPDTVRVGRIGDGLEARFPAEDRVLLYEHLVAQLKSEKTIAGVYRAGNNSAEANCAEFEVKVRPVAFDKGDQALRASVGPLGHFVGTTKLRYHLTVSTQDGTTIADEDLKAAEGSDTDSLNITKVISKKVVKTLKKSRTQARKAQLS